MVAAIKSVAWPRSNRSRWPRWIGICTHLNSIERLWGLMHRHITHNKCYASFREFSTAMLTFLSEEVPKNWHDYCDEVTDNFRVIAPTEFPIIA